MITATGQQLVTQQANPVKEREEALFLEEKHHKFISYISDVHPKTGVTLFQTKETPFFMPIFRPACLGSGTINHATLCISNGAILVTSLSSFQ